MKRSILLVFSMIASLVIWAQNGSEEIGMADTMRQNGKIYVVVAVLLTIMAGLIIYLVRLDRKLSKLEKTNS
jgi:hypothetical protein